MAGKKTTCTHSELIAQVFTLEAELSAFEKLMDERDKRYEQRAKAQDDAVAAAMVAAKEATIVAKTEVDSHLKSLNEIRTMSLDQAKTFAVGKVVDLQIDGLKAEVKGVRETVLTQTAHVGGIKDAWGYFAVAAGLVIAALAIYFKH